MKTNQLVQTLKDNGEDFEFYPTTPEIINAVNHLLDEGCSVMDIGAGRGGALAGFTKASEKYAIEKSQTLIAMLPDNVFVVGTDFHRQTLVDKKVDVIFCNPPFSEFADWAAKIIREANAQTVYLVMPERWKDNAGIMAAINDRDAKYKTIAPFSFLEADRKARGTVNLVKVDLTDGDRWNKSIEVDPFFLWFNETFKEVQGGQTFDTNYSAQEAIRDEIRSLVSGRNLIETLEELYLKDMDLLIKTYRSITDIPADLLKEVGVKRGEVISSLKLKIEGMKQLYWKELFDNLTQITDRLASDSRKKLLCTLTANTHVDFTAENAYAIVLWAIKNANGYLDSQLVHLYKRLSNQDAAIAYKSNIHFSKSDFRYNYGNELSAKQYKLDYRIVVPCHAFGTYEWDRRAGRMSETAMDLINDLCTIGKNLGFDVRGSASSVHWCAGIQHIYHHQVADMGGEKKEEFMRVRCYMNGNAHLILNKEFMLKLNVEAARILGWISTPEQAAEEMEVSVTESQKAFGSSYKITIDGIKLLGTSKEAA
jgi:hypothetical protein